MDIMDLLKSQVLNDGLLEQLTQQVGAQDKQQTAKAAEGALSMLLGAMAKNTAQPEGADALANALDNDHDGGILDDVMGFLGGGHQNTRAANGSGILKHVLGGNQSNAFSAISALSGLGSKESGSLMTMLAPMVMSALGKQKREQGLDASGLASMLGGVLGGQRKQASSSPLMGMVTSFLDKDGDGSIVDDALGMLGGLFKK